MFEFRDLFQWDRFITPTVIKTFYWLVIALIVLTGVSGVFSGLRNAKQCRRLPEVVVWTSRHRAVGPTAHERDTVDRPCVVGQ